MPVPSKLVKHAYSRITLTKYTTAYFIVALVHAILLCGFQLGSHLSNKRADNTLSQILEAASIQQDLIPIVTTQDGQDVLRLCNGIPRSNNDSRCQTIFVPTPVSNSVDNSTPVNMGSNPDVNPITSVQPGATTAVPQEAQAGTSVISGIDVVASTALLFANQPSSTASDNSTVPTDTIDAVSAETALTIAAVTETSTAPSSQKTELEFNNSTLAANSTSIVSELPTASIVTGVPETTESAVTESAETTSTTEEEAEETSTADEETTTTSDAEETTSTSTTEEATATTTSAEAQETETETEVETTTSTAEEVATETSTSSETTTTTESTSTSTTSTSTTSTSITSEETTTSSESSSSSREETPTSTSSASQADVTVNETTLSDAAAVTAIFQSPIFSTAAPEPTPTSVTSEEDNVTTSSSTVSEETSETTSTSSTATSNTTESSVSSEATTSSSTTESTSTTSTSTSEAESTSTTSLESRFNSQKFRVRRNVHLQPGKRALDLVAVTNSTTGQITGLNVTGLAGVDSSQATFVNITCAQTLTLPEDQLHQQWTEDLVMVGYHFWLFGMGAVAVMNESIPHLIAAFVVSVLALVWSGSQLARTRAFHKQFDMFVVDGACNGFDLMPNYWKQREMVELPSFIINCVAVLALGGLGFKLLSVYKRETSKITGGDGIINHLYKVVLTLSIIMQVTAFLLMASLCLWVQQLFNSPIASFSATTPAFKGVGMVSVLLAIPWFVIGWIAIRKENKKLMLVFLAMNSFFIASWVAFFSSDTYRLVFTKWTFFSAITVATFFLLVGSLIAGILCRMRFGQGLAVQLAEQAKDEVDVTPWEFSSQTEKAWERFDKLSVRQSQFTSSDRQSSAFSYGLRSPMPPMPQMPSNSRFSAAS